MSFRSACARNGPPAGLQAPTQLNFNRDSSLQQAEGWTCHRALDGAYVQFDCIIGDADFNLNKHGRTIVSPLPQVCPLQSRKEPYKQQYRRKHVLKGWRPLLDKNGQPTGFQTLVDTKMGEQDTYTFDVAENFLISTVVATGICSRQTFKFTPPQRLRLLRHKRKQVYDIAIRKFFDFPIPTVTPKGM